MQRFIKKNQVVVIKPNIGWNAEPERAANTNPKLIGRVVEHCFEAGAKEVWICDSGHMLFYTPEGKSKSSVMIPGFPQQIKI